MTKTIALIQSNYIPWKGYFDQINMAVIFVFYDDVQYTTRDWRNRNKVKTKAGVKWLTIPCGKDLNRLICDVSIESSYWQRKHWATLCQSYSKSRYFRIYKEFFEELYLGREWKNLSELNQTFIKRISTELLGTATEFMDSRKFSLSPEMKKEDRWIELLRLLGGTDFIVGPSARGYLDLEKQQKVKENGINLIWMNYSGYPEYKQLFPPFIHHVSVLDLLFNVGPDAPYFIWGWRK